MQAYRPRLPVVLLGAQGELGCADHHGLGLIDLFLDALDKFGHLAVAPISLLDEARVDPGRVVRGGGGSVQRVDLDAPEALELRSRLGDDDGLAVLVLYRLHVLLVAVAVDDDVYPAGVRHHGVAAPLLGNAGLAQVREQHHVVGPALSTDLVHGCLNRLVERRPVLVAAEEVGVLALVVLEVVEKRPCRGRRREHAHEPYAHRPGRGLEVQQAVRVEDPRAVGVEEVAAHVRQVLLPAQLQKTVDAVVELMVSAGNCVVSARGHHLHGRRALRDCGLRLALQVVAGIHQGHVGFPVHGALLAGVVGKGGVAEVRLRVLEGAVHVVGVQDDDALAVRRALPVGLVCLAARGQLGADACQHGACGGACQPCKRAAGDSIRAHGAFFQSVARVCRET